MGMMMLPPFMVSLPFKLMLFVLIDGWNLLVGSHDRALDEVLKQPEYVMSLGSEALNLFLSYRCLLGVGLVVPDCLWQCFRLPRRYRK